MLDPRSPDARQRVFVAGTQTWRTDSAVAAHLLPIDDLSAIHSQLADPPGPIIVLATRDARSNLAMIKTFRRRDVAVVNSEHGLAATCWTASIVAAAMQQDGAAVALWLAHQLPTHVTSQILTTHLSDSHPSNPSFLDAARSLLPGSKVSMLTGSRIGVDIGARPQPPSGLAPVASGTTQPSPGAWADEYLARVTSHTAAPTVFHAERTRDRPWSEVVWWDEMAAHKLLENPSPTESWACGWCSQVSVTTICAFCGNVEQFSEPVAEHAG